MCYYYIVETTKKRKPTKPVKVSTKIRMIRTQSIRTGAVKAGLWRLSISLALYRILKSSVKSSTYATTNGTYIDNGLCQCGIPPRGRCSSIRCARSSRFRVNGRSAAGRFFLFTIAADIRHFCRRICMRSIACLSSK